MLVLNLPFKALMFLTLMRPSLVSFLVLWLKLVKDFLKVRFFFNDTATTEIYTLSLHDALPILRPSRTRTPTTSRARYLKPGKKRSRRSEEHTSELQSPDHLVCRLLLEKKKYRILGLNPPVKDVLFRARMMSTRILLLDLWLILI